MPTYAADPTGSGGRRQGVLTVFFIVLAVLLINVPSAVQQEVAWAVRVTALSPFVWIQETLARARVQSSESGRLRAILDSMVAVSTARTHLVEENRRLRGLLSLSERIGPSWVAASVIRAGTMGSESMLQLNVGSTHGVRVNAPIITRHGLVGLVREVRARSALGMDWTHPDFGASAMSADGLAYGLVETRRGVFREEDRLEFAGTEFYTTLDPGTPVLTSGRGGVFPRGIPIGRIVEVAEEDADWHRSYWLEPMVDPAAATHVLVGTGLRARVEDLSAVWPADSVRTDAELRELEETRLDSLTILRDSLAGLRERIRELAPAPDSGRAPAASGAPGDLPPGRGGRVRAPGEGPGGSRW